MKACIVYGTKRGATAKVAKLIGETLQALGVDVVVRTVKEASIEDCDLVVVGTPIYYERPLQEVMRFLDENEGLEGKKVAVFILCIASRFGKLGRAYTERQYVRKVLEHLRTEPVSVKVFEGWILSEKKDTLREARRWAKELWSLMSKR
jgi:menaquinone-dependent protoporphyrinogen oxidase